MTIEFLYGRREALFGKSEAYKKSVRAYLEAIGFSQTTDSAVEGTFKDMTFYNPLIAPGVEFRIEAKAEEVSSKSKKFARELINYFKLWRNKDADERFRFWLFVQGVKTPSNWELLFSENNDPQEVRKWCRWYNEKCCESDTELLDHSKIEKVITFFSESNVKVGNKVDLDNAIIEKHVTSISDLNRKAKQLLNIVNKRKQPIMSKSFLIMNILPIQVPTIYYVCRSFAKNKKEIYEGLKDEIIPPFLFTRNKRIMTFSEFDEENPLIKYLSGSIRNMDTKKFQINNPQFCSSLINIHLRRIIWKKGVYRDEDIYYFPMIDKTKEKREELNYTKRKIWVTKKLLHKKDTKYAKKGDVNFYLHRGTELRTPTYWGTSFIEIIPRKYYTLDGISPIKGKTRAKMDAKFRNPTYDRSIQKLRLMRFWKYYLFESKKFEKPREKWFDKFTFGDFLSESVYWSPKVIGRDQTRLWDFEVDL